MKLLYVSSWHGTLEHDELILFTELGIEWFSTGLYLDPQKPMGDHSPRTALKNTVDTSLKDEFLRSNPDHRIYTTPILTKEFVDKFDIILIEHCSPTLLNPLHANWNNIKHKPVIWRTYAQQNGPLEFETQQYRAQGLKLVRISPKERNILNYAGDDAIIRAFIDDNEYSNWTGEEPIVLTFNNMFSRRTLHSNTPIYMRIRNKMKPVPFELYGCDNEDTRISLGKLTWEQVKDKYRKARVYFALGSKPASLTYNLVEAMMTGCPVVTWGPALGNLRKPGWPDTYEAHEIIQHGKDGFWSDNELEIESYIRMLLKDDSLAQKISANARKKAQSIFAKEKIKNDWAQFLNGLV